MASASGIRAGAAYIELSTRDSRFVKGLASAKRRLQAFSASIGDMGAQFMRFSAYAALPFLAGAKVYADFEQQMANVATMLDEPAKYMELYKKRIREMSVEFGESTDALAGGLYDILSASVPAAQALQVLEVAVRAAKAGMTDTKTAADAITTVLNSYGLSADHAAEVSDLLFSIVKRGKTTFAELAPAIGNVANIANTAGISLEEMGAVIAMLTRNGIKTREAITSLRGIIVAFLKPSEEAAKMAKELGFELNVATLQSEGLAGILQRLSSLPADALARLFPNVEGLKGILPILRNMAGFSEDLAAMTNRAGTTEAAFKKMTSTLMHAFNQLKQGAIAVLSVLGEAVAEPLSVAIGWIKRYALMAQDLIQNNRDVVSGVLKVIGVIGGLGAALVAVAIAGKALTFVIGGIGAILSTVGALFGLVASAVGAILSPIGLAITGLVALGAYLIYASGTGAKALEWLGQKFQALREFALSAWLGISDAMAAGDMSLAVKVAWLSIQVIWRQGVQTLKTYWLNFKEWFQSLTTHLFYGAVIVIAQAFYGLQSIWEKVTYTLADLWTCFTEGIQFGWRTAQYYLEKGLYDLVALYKKHSLVFEVVAPGLAAALDTLKDLDPEKAKQNAEKEWVADAQRLENQRDEEISQRKEDHEARLKQIQDEESGTISEIVKAADDEERVRREQNEKEIKESQDALNKAKQEWQDAVDEARQKRENFEIGQENPDTAQAPDFAEPDIAKKLGENLKNVGAEVEKMVFDIVGTFDAGALRGIGLGQNTTQERTAKAAEDTAKNTKRMADKMDDAEGLVFE